MESGLRIIVSGTDTGIGKTHFCITLGKFLQANKIDFAIYKPFATGTITKSENFKIGRFQDWKIREIYQIEDIYSYKKELGLEINKNLFVSKTFGFPNAPTIASVMERRKLSEDEFDKAIKLYKTIANKHKNVIIEGIGGLLVPLTFNKLFIDFIRVLKLPVILITTNKLGTINHTLLSIKLLQDNKMPFLIIFNETDTKKSKRENKAILNDIKRFAKIENILTLPFQKNIYQTKKMNFPLTFSTSVR